MPALEQWPCLHHFCLFSGSFVNFLDSIVLLGPNSGNFMCWYRTEFFSLVMHIYVLISSRIRATTKDPLSVNTMCETWLARSSIPLCSFVYNHAFGNPNNAYDDSTGSKLAWKVFLVEWSQNIWGAAISSSLGWSQFSASLEAPRSTSTMTRRSEVSESTFIML